MPPLLMTQTRTTSHLSAPHSLLIAHAPLLPSLRRPSQDQRCLDHDASSLAHRNEICSVPRTKRAGYTYRPGGDRTGFNLIRSVVIWPK
jgi:hypothetical protein